MHHHDGDKNAVLFSLKSGPLHSTVAWFAILLRSLIQFVDEIYASRSSYEEVNGLEKEGQVEIFQYDSNTMEWIQVGERLNGKARGFFWKFCGLVVRWIRGWSWCYKRDANGENSGSAYVFTVN